MANFIRHFDNVLENLEVTGKKVRHFDNDPFQTDDGSLNQSNHRPGYLNQSERESDHHFENPDWVSSDNA